jgi:hypothetical protein
MNAPETVPATLTFATLPPHGADLDGGLFVGLTTDKQGAHHAVVLLPAKPDQDLAWKDAMAWAESVGGVLPTRPVAALLFANAKDQFESRWHWLSEKFDRSSAWGQYFGYGGQDFGRKSYEGRARAVRLIQLTA